MSFIHRVIDTVIGPFREFGRAFYRRREELMRGPVDALWEFIHVDGRTYALNRSRDIEVQEAWFSAPDGSRQALGPVRPGERSEIRAWRRVENNETDLAAGASEVPEVRGVLRWRVRSMLLPWVSIYREESLGR